MHYPIEVLCTKEYLYEAVLTASESLNKVQGEFHFFIPPDRLKKEPYSFVRDHYTTRLVWDWLKEYKKKGKGRRAYIILVVDGELEGPELSNLFGSHVAKAGFAVFTTASYNHYVKDLIRFCAYYLVRYSLSFVAPTAMAHETPDRVTCMFHKKINKKEIEASLRSGKLCDDCRKELDNYSNQEIDGAIESMLKTISNQLPMALVMKGGGVKGLAFAGALMELEGHFAFETFVGTSAGAITAVLLGAGYNSQDLLNILGEKDFNSFKDSIFPLTFLRLALQRGLYPGNEIEEWISGLIKRKINNQVSEIEMKHLKHTIVYASRFGDGLLAFDSKGDRKNAHASFAARCSMSVPYFFVPRKVDGARVYDGGLRNNFPVTEFMESYPKQPFIGLYLLSDAKKSGFVFMDMFNITVEGEERKAVDRHISKTVLIDTRPIATLDFNLNKAKKEYLVLSGRIAAKEFLLRYHPDSGVYKSEINSLIKKKNALFPILYEKQKKQE